MQSVRVIVPVTRTIVAIFPHFYEHLKIVLSYPESFTECNCVTMKTLKFIAEFSKAMIIYNGYHRPHIRIAIERFNYLKTL